VPIGRFVLRAASTAAARWHADGHLVGVTVNVAGRQLDEPGFADDVGEALAASGLPAPFLTLEVTETQLLRDIDATSARLAVLRGLGVRVAIDDFGTGLSSLDHLRRLSVNSIKVDRSFVSVLGRSAEGASLVHSFIEMGKSLGLETLAEGIEEQSQLAELLKDRCDEGQGFLLARPLEEAEVGSFLAASGDFMVSAEPWPRAVQVQGSNGGRGHRIPRGGDVPPRR